MENQKINNNIIFCLSIILFLFKFSFNYIVLPFKIHIPQKTNNMTEIVYNLVENKLIITLPIGTPEKRIDFYATMNQYIYYLEEGSCLKDSSTTYSFSESKSFYLNNTLSPCNFKLDTCSLAQEKLYLYQDINLKEKTDISQFKIVYGKRKKNMKKDNKEICGIIGFQIENLPYHYYGYDNFIKILKKHSKIDSYSWFIHYYDKPYKINDNEYYDGAIIIDIFNQKFFNDFPYLKNDNDYNTVNVRDYEAILAWTFPFDKIFYTINDTKIEINNKEGGLAFETDFVLCPEGYFKSIKIKYFDYYFKNNICFLQKGRYHYIYCDKNSFSNNIKNFPVLFFRSNGLNRTFTLDGDDLFKEFNNYYIFMIIFKEYSYKYWTLGKIFMKKYKFYFDSDKKIIGCFDINNQVKEGTNLIINVFDKIKWYLFIIIAIIIGFLIGKKIRDKSRKLRANELEDNYEYLSNKSINKDNSQTFSNYKEIRSQLYDINQENSN